jgi:hypothetical protein
MAQLRRTLFEAASGDANPAGDARVRGQTARKPGGSA